MLVLVSGATRTPRSDTVGHLIVPGSWNAPASLGLVPGRWAMDNGAFGGAFDPGQFVSMLEAFSGWPGCLFVAAPDVIYKSRIGDAAKTREKWPFWSKLIRGLGFLPAFVLQDGLRPEQVPWGEFGSVFIGGSDTFKNSPLVVSICAYAKARGVKVHWGRVNGPIRYKQALSTGCDSIDGTGFSRWPDTNIPLVQQWDAEIQQQPELSL